MRIPQNYSLIILICLAFSAFSSCNNSSEKIRNKNSGPDTSAIPENSIPMIYNEYVIVQAMVDSVRGGFIIDLASDWFLIDTLFYSNHNKLRNLSYSYSDISGIGNSSVKIIVIDDSITFTLKDISYNTYSIPVINMKPIGGDLIDGAIGTDLLSRYVLEVNYINEYISLYNNINLIDTTGYEVIKMVNIDNYLCIPVDLKINDSVTISGNFIVDTGSPASTLTSSVAEEMKLSGAVEKKFSYYTRFGGIGGESSGYDFFCKTLQISGFKLPNASMSFSLDTAGVLSKQDYFGIIGNNILSRFDLIFDFKNMNLYMRPNESFNQPFALDKLGFFYVERYKTTGGWVVTGYYENCDAIKKGLKIGDKITSVNSINVKNLPHKEKAGILSKSENVVIEFERNDTVHKINFKIFTL